MANIVAIQPVIPFSVREFVSATTLNSQLSAKVLSLYQNMELINEHVSYLLQGISGGIEQAKIPFSRSSAPTGWTRDVTFLNDHILRVTDGVTMPPGFSPVASGGAHGGSWEVSGISSSVSGSHLHSMGSHTHSIGSHTHTIASHYHGMNHTHDTLHNHPMFSPTESIPASTTTSIRVYTNAVVFGGSPANHTHMFYDSGDSSIWARHRHTIGGTTPSITAPSSTETGYTAPSTSAQTSTTSSAGDTDSSGSHYHTFTHDSGWRPKYLNIIMCGKD